MESATLINRVSSNNKIKIDRSKLLSIGTISTYSAVCFVDVILLENVSRNKADNETD